MKLSTRFAFGFFSCSALLLAQGPPGGGRGGPGFPPPMFGLAGHGGFREMGMQWGKVVTGAPYSATTKDSVTQTLADGNKISRVTTGQVARDSQGRTYSEQTIAGPWSQGSQQTVTFISDPVAGYSYVLNSSNKTAMRRPFRERTAGRPPHGPMSEGQGRNERDLGDQSIGGVTASGKEITRTIPAGQIGNAQAIVEKTEIWTDPQLQVVVQSTHSDPRWGQSMYQLSNIQTTEPNPALFQVPSGYTVTDAPDRWHRE